jgi:hypothetical protein
MRFPLIDFIDRHLILLPELPDDDPPAAARSTMTIVVEKGQAHEEFVRTKLHPFASLLSRRPRTIVIALYALYILLSVLGISVVVVRFPPPRASLRLCAHGPFTRARARPRRRR